MMNVRRIAVNVCRIILAMTFIFSGFVKAVDPLGTQYKIQDYLGALSLHDVLPDWLTLCTSVGLAALEFCLGIFLLFAIHRRVVSRMVLVLMAVMTIISLWLAIWNPVKDCGCFGDAVTLTNGQTLLKNLLLLAAAIVVWKYPLDMMRFISKTNQWIVINYTVVFILVVSAWCLYDRPIFDFRPYHIGANIREGMEIPEGEQGPQFETTFILEKDGVQKTFTLDEYPDSTWTFIDSKTVQTAEGYVPPIHDFSIVRRDNDEDITEEVVSDKGYTFLLIAPQLDKADDSNFGDIDQIYEYCLEHQHPFYCLTASSDDAVREWTERTGAEYPFCTTDETTLKTIIRSNPGLLLLKDGQIIRKWSHNRLPELKAPLATSEYGSLPAESVSGKIIRILLWFVLPLLLLAIADRLWAWTQWVKKKENEIKTTIKKETS